MIVRLHDAWGGFEDIKVDKVLYQDGRIIRIDEGLVSIYHGIIIAKKEEDICILVSLQEDIKYESKIHVKDFSKILGVK